MWAFILNLLKGMGKSALMNSSQPQVPSVGSQPDLMAMIRSMMGGRNGE